MSIKGLRDEIKVALSSISGLQIYDTIPESPAPPCAMVKPITGDYDLTAGVVWNPLFEITILVGKQGDVSISQDSLDDYIEPSGTKSVKYAVENGTYTHASALRVARFRDYSGYQFGSMQANYLGVKFDVEILI